MVLRLASWPNWRSLNWRSLNWRSLNWRRTTSAIRISDNRQTTKDGGDIVPITSATISSRAVCDAIARGVEVYNAIQQQKQEAR